MKKKDKIFNFSQFNGDINAMFLNSPHDKGGNKW